MFARDETSPLKYKSAEIQLSKFFLRAAFRPVNILEPTEKEGEEAAVDKSLDLHPEAATHSDTKV